MKTCLFILLLAFFGCKQIKSPEKKVEPVLADILGDNFQDPDEISCWGIGEIEFDDNPESLTQKIGEENLTTDSLFEEGMHEGFVTKVWKGTPREVVIYWREKIRPVRKIAFMETRHPSSVYHFSNGIRVGTTVNELVKLNGGKEIGFYGFGWDYAGTFESFNGGKLAGNIPCFGGVIGLDSLSYATIQTDLLGDHVINSSQLGSLVKKARLISIRIKGDA